MRHTPVLILALAAVTTPPWASLAQEARVGTATTVDRSVTAAGGVALRDVRNGSPVMREDVLTSDARGRARLQFVDDTLVTFGPSSTLRIAQIALRIDRRASEFVLDATKGVFRFATGKSSHDAYKIETPTATLGVRGTQFHFTVTDRETRVAVTQGAVQICPRESARSECKLVRAGQSVRTDARRASVTQGLTKLALSAPALVPAGIQAVRTLAPATPDLSAPVPLRSAPQLGGAPGFPSLPPAPVMPGLGGGGILGGGRGGIGGLTGGGLQRR